MAKQIVQSASLAPIEVEPEMSMQIEAGSDTPASIEAEIAALEARLVVLKMPPKVEFPKWVYHGDHRDGKLVNSQEEFDALEDGWGEKEDADAARKAQKDS